MYPIPHTSDYIALIMVHPRLGHIHWQIQEKTVKALKAIHKERFNGAYLIARIYDITDILFDGLNAHMFFDLAANRLSGNYYFGIDRLGRHYLAELGFRFRDGAFHCLARSNTALFDRDRPSGNYQPAGLFIGGKLNKIFSVENIFDAPIYERVNQALGGIKRKKPLSVAVVFLGVNHAAGFKSPLGSFIKKIFHGFKKFGGEARLFAPPSKEVSNVDNKFLISTINSLSKKIYKEVAASHKKMPFQVIHCHDWYSSAIGLSAAKRLNMPMILTLHSTEYERTHGSKKNRYSSMICEREKKGVQGAHLVIVPHLSSRQQVINLYHAPPEKVVIIPDVFTEASSHAPTDPSEVKRWFGLNQEGPVVLFAGEISHAAGADLLMDALPTVCRNNSIAQFVFAGEGPLKAELESRAWYAGLGHCCRFLGDVPKETFESLLIASDFLVIPARTWQDEGLARMAIGSGVPVLATHQAGCNCVAHGENGLVTYDNPGSIVWGIQELLSNPLQGKMLRLAAKKSATNKTPSIENISAQHYMYYETILKRFYEGSKNA